MDRLESMAVFVRAVERGGFSAAAAELGLSGTMVGLHVRALEDRLGARLLNRTTRQSLTEVGRLYYERCRQILGDVEAADASAAELQGAPRGRLKVTAPVSFGVHALTPACADYLALYPEVRLDLVVNDRAVDLIDEGFEAAIRIGDLVDSSLIARPLAPYRSLMCASPAYLEKYGEPQSPEDLGAHACLSLAHPVAGQTWRLQGPAGPVTVAISGGFTVNNGEALRMAALAGLGIIMQPQILLADDLAQGRLLPVLPSYAPAPRPMHLLTQPDRRPTPKLSTFVEFVMRRFGRGTES